MKNYAILLLFTIVANMNGTTMAQSQNPKSQYENFKQQARKQYDDFRTKANQQYADFLSRVWRRYNGDAPIEKPKEKEIAPIEYDKKLYDKERKDEAYRDDEGDMYYQQKGIRRKVAIRRGGKGKELIFDEVIRIPDQEPQPTPISPIYEKDGITNTFTVKFFGLSCPLRFDSQNLISLQGLDELSVSAAWSRLSNNDYDNAIRDLLAIRINQDLCDWSYLQLLNQTALQLYGSDCNESVLLTAWLYCQSGYKMRLAFDDKRLYMLYSSHHIIYDEAYFNIDGEYFYIFGDRKPETLYICDKAFPSEAPMSLLVGKEQKLGTLITESRKLVSKKYPFMSVLINENKTLMDFYSTYPTSKLGDNDVSRWAMYAYTPICKHTKEQLYPMMRNYIQGKTALEGVSMILDWVQTAFVYEYDDKVWGHDRAFFPDETLYYPYCDCEDRSILFSRLVRDILSLDVALIYYPGHLATAVCFNEDISGDAMLIDGRKFIICDPTYIGAPVGAQMPNLDYDKAQAIVLNR
ncbi:hypothetical protein [Duncaniella muris]|uniref:hypothetical protein n=1 Tax=Duncaniella muris TaxID=2094150 RepID=UPI00272DE979|nr:hypothetical protein [Duncaniella muris]